MKTYLFLLLICFFAAQKATGQSEKAFHVSGDLGISTEFYDFTTNDSTLHPRRPDFNYRLFFNPVFHFGEKISLPVSLVATKRFNSAYLPLPNYDNPLQSLTNPNNAIGLHPTFGWATFHLGSHTADFSELSTGNLPVFGAGVDLRPGVLRLAYTYGVQKWALRPDTTLQLSGNYQRRFQALKLGVGYGNSYFGINTAKVEDVVSSVDSVTRLPHPQEGALATLEAAFEFSQHVKAKAEAGASAFTKNTFDDKVEDTKISNFPEYLFTARQSSRLDYASTFSIEANYKNWGLALRRKKLGAGFEPLGFGFVETDVLDYTASPRLQLFQNKFLLHATIGQRTDNLSHTKLSTTKRLIASGNMMAIFSKSFSLSANYSNYGARNNVANDTLRLEFVSRNLAVTPVLRIQRNDLSHTLSFTFGLSDFDDKNLFSGELATNRTQTLSSSYTFARRQFTVMATGSYMQNDRSTGALDIRTVMLQPGYGFLKRKLNISTGLVWSVIGQEGYTDSRRFVLRPRVRWRLTKQLTFDAQGSLNMYRYGSIRPGAMYDESYLQTGLTQRF